MLVGLCLCGGGGLWGGGKGLHVYRGLCLWVVGGEGVYVCGGACVLDAVWSSAFGCAIMRVGKVCVSAESPVFPKAHMCP